jgi:hypothetical protein
MSAMPPSPSSFNTAKPVPNHLLWSILVTVFNFLVCCIACWNFPGLITGIVAIVFSSKVNSRLNAGDVAGAEQASRNARIWAWVTTGFLILGVLAFFISLAFMGGTEGYMERIHEIRQQIEANR